MVVAELRTMAPVRANLPKCKFPYPHTVPEVTMTVIGITAAQQIEHRTTAHGAPQSSAVPMQNKTFM